MDQTARFALPYLAPGQMQKEFYHNEALQKIDMLLCPVVEGSASSTPPSNPAVGSCYLIAPGATGAWAANDGALACFSEGGWRFVPPIEGMSLMDRGSGRLINRRNGQWETGRVYANELVVDGLAVIRGRQPAIGDPSGGVQIDGECRAAVGQILAAMRAHGLIG
jgi:hypothetical protein